MHYEIFNMFKTIFNQEAQLVYKEVFGDHAFNFNDDPTSISEAACEYEPSTIYQKAEAMKNFASVYMNKGRKEHLIRSFRDVIPLIEEYRHAKQEHFLSLTLDGSGYLIQRRIVTIGTLNSSLVHPREGFAPAIEERAASIIVAHNHPSGSVQPSQEDHNVTRRLRQSGELLGIPLLDHIIISSAGEVSFKEERLLN